MYFVWRSDAELADSYLYVSNVPDGQPFLLPKQFKGRTGELRDKLRYRRRHVFMGNDLRTGNFRDLREISEGGVL